MLDWMFLVLLFIAVLFLWLSITLERENTYWNMMFLVMSTVLWFILSIQWMNIQTFYPTFNTTTGNTTAYYDLFVEESSLYLSYFFLLMGILCMIYILIVVFGIYYERLDEKEEKNWKGND